MSQRVIRITIGLVLLLLATTSGAGAAKPSTGAGLLPDLRTVVPTHLQLVNAG